MEELSSLEQLNWELCVAYLDTTIRESQECQIKLSQAEKNVKDVKELEDNLYGNTGLS